MCTMPVKPWCHFTLSFRGETTASLLFNAAAADVKAALEALDSVGTVLVNATSASATTTMYSVSFVPWMGATQVHTALCKPIAALFSHQYLFGWACRGIWRTTAACR